MTTECASFSNYNPWLLLPTEAPFVLSIDKPIIDAFNQKISESSPYFLRVQNMLPEPFLGDPKAPILVLSNNPGFGRNPHLRQQPRFMSRMRDDICLRLSTYPFVYLDPDYHDTGRWWRQKLKHVIQRFGDEVVARSICNVVCFPYVSKRYGHRDCEVPSQQFGFGLVRAAVERGAVIVLMRKGQEKWWREKVPELQDYHSFLRLRNPRMPAISPNNCDSGDYERIIDAIERAESQR
jgi:hypothetical protein